MELSAEYDLRSFIGLPSSTLYLLDSFQFSLSFSTTQPNQTQPLHPPQLLTSSLFVAS